jgi:hypothetical protein
VPLAGFPAVFSVTERSKAVEIDPVGEGYDPCGIHATCLEFLPEETGEGEKAVCPPQTVTASGKGEMEERL